MGKKALRSEKHQYCQQQHAQIRAKERLGRQLTNQEFSDLTYQIESGLAEKLGNVQESRVAYRMIVADQECRVIWDRKTKQIVTFYTADMRLTGLDTKPVKRGR